MTDEVNAAPEVKTEDVKVEQKTPTVAEIIGEKKEDKAEPKVVPEAVFLEEKNARKALQREVRELRSMIEGGASKGEITATLDDLAKDYDVDPKFLNRLAGTIRKEVEDEAEKKVTDRLKPFEERDRAKNIENVFNTHFEKAMDDMDEYKGVARREAIFALSKLPENQSKTIPQLIEETYGSAISGKRSMETTTPQRSTRATEFDPERANSDASYLKEVYADPELKKQMRAWQERNR